MKIQIIVAAAILAFVSTSAFAGGGRHQSKGTYVDNDARNSTAIMSSRGGSDHDRKGNDGRDGARGLAIAGSIVLEGGACACDFSAVKNKSRDAKAIGSGAIAGSVLVNTAYRN